MNIIYMGTPEFAVPSLKMLIDCGHNITSVFCQPDKPKGRGHKMLFPPVKELAVEHNIPVFQPTTLKNEDIQNEIKSQNPDLIVVVAYGKILPKAVLEAPKFGCVNIHGSLLPKYRGAGPIQWSVLNGDKETGVTTMFMADGIDTGDMLLKAKTEIGENETADELYERLSFIGADLLKETVEKLSENALEPVRQNDAEATHAPMLSKEMCNLDFSQSAQLVHNKIRGLSSWPCAQTTLMGKRLKIYKSEIVNINEKGEAGEILSSKEFLVACGDNTAIKLTEVQFEGAKRMNGGDFLRGRRIEKGTKLEF